MDPFLTIDFGDRPDAGDDDGEENCPNFGSSILFLALSAPSLMINMSNSAHIVLKTWIGQRLSDPRAIHTFTYT